jgi:hypothetical protein
MILNPIAGISSDTPMPRPCARRSGAELPMAHPEARWVDHEADIRAGYCGARAEKRKIESSTAKGPIYV